MSACSGGALHGIRPYVISRKQHARSLGHGSWIRGPVPGSEGLFWDPRDRPRIRGSVPGSEGPTPDPRVRPRIRGSEPRAGLEAGRGEGGVHLGPKCTKVQKCAKSAKMSATHPCPPKVVVNTVVLTLPRGPKAREIAEKVQKVHFYSLSRRSPKYLVHVCKSALGVFCDAKMWNVGKSAEMSVLDLQKPCELL